MPTSGEYDAVVVGAGPNGLAAAITLVQAGCRVLLIEGQATVGGGLRSAELTLPGFVHDICSAIHPLGLSSPLFRDLPLARHGLKWIHPPAPVAHPLGGEHAALLERTFTTMDTWLGPDARAWRRLFEPVVEHWDKLADMIFRPLVQWPPYPLLLARFGLRALLPARTLARVSFRGKAARGLFAGLAAHSMLPLTRVASASFGLVLGALGHAVGWPVAEGGSGRVAAALAGYFRALGGEVVTGWWVKSLAELPPARAVLFDVTPRQLLEIVGERFPPGYRRALRRYRYGMGAFKLDWALDGPIPWSAPACQRAATVHLGGTLDQIDAAEAAAWRGQIPERPYVLVAQQSLFDPTRAPGEAQVAWAYCHVPPGSHVDMAPMIEAQIERAAPGFRDRILARHILSPARFERYNPNYVGGDINGGIQDLWGIVARPALRLVPYATPLTGVYLCSSSTPPGGGVHGMCGYHAARAVLRARF